MEKEFRRKAPRRKFEGTVGALYDGTMTLVPCLQLGEGGALIAKDSNLQPIQKGDHLLITIVLVNIGPVVAKAECVYLADDSHIGLQFINLDTRYKKLIREFVSRRKIREVA